MIYNQADCQLSGEGEVQTAQIAGFWEKHPARNCDSLRWGDGLLGYLFCLATWTWQTDESSLPGGADRLTRGEKRSCRSNKGLVSGEDTAPGRRNICLLVAADGSASQNKICTMTSSIRREYFIPEMTFSPEVACWSLEDYVCVYTCVS